MKRKIFLTLLVFAVGFGVAVYFKTQAGTGENGSGWLWGGGAEVDGVSPWDGSNTNVRWISFNNTNRGWPISYGVNIPASGTVTGYAWSDGDNYSPGLGYIDFNPWGPDGLSGTADDHCVTGVPGANQYQAASCAPPSGSGIVTRSGDNLTGWARIVEIAKETTTGNAGGWTGWIHMNGSNYGVQVSKMDGRSPGDAGDLGPTYAWSGGETTPELGWIDFGRASITAATYSLKICTTGCNASGVNQTGGTINLQVGSTAQLYACWVPSDTPITELCNINGGSGGGLDVTQSVSTSWSPAASAAATVNNTSPNKGLVTGNSAGSNNITATYLTNPSVAVMFNITAPSVSCYRCDDPASGICTNVGTSTDCAASFAGSTANQSNCDASCNLPGGDPYKEVNP